MVARDVQEASDTALGTAVGFSALIAVVALLVFVLVILRFCPHFVTRRRYIPADVLRRRFSRHRRILHDLAKAKAKGEAQKGGDDDDDDEDKKAAASDSDSSDSSSSSDSDSGSGSDSDGDDKKKKKAKKAKKADSDDDDDKKEDDDDEVDESEYGPTPPPRDVRFFYDLVMSNDEDLLPTHGLDAVTFLMCLRLALHVILVQAVTGVILAFVNGLAGTRDDPPPSGEPVNNETLTSGSAVLSMANLDNGDVLVVPAIGAILNSIFSWIVLYKGYLNWARLRARARTLPDDVVLAQTILYQNAPDTRVPLIARAPSFISLVEPRKYSVVDDDAASPLPVTAAAAALIAKAKAELSGEDGGDDDDDDEDKDKDSSSSSSSDSDSDSDSDKAAADAGAGASATSDGDDGDDDDASEGNGTERFLRHIYGPTTPILAANPVLQRPSVMKLQMERAGLLAQLEGALAQTVANQREYDEKIENGEEAEEPEPVEIKVGKPMPINICLGEPVVALDYLPAEIAKIDARIAAKQAGEHKDRVAAGFVAPMVMASFASPTAATLAANSAVGAEPGTWEASPAPEPEAIHWENVGVSAAERMLRTWLVRVAIFLLVLLWMIPVSAVAAVSNFASLSKVPGVDLIVALILESELLTGIVAGILPSLALTIFMAILEPLIRVLVSLKKPLTFASTETSVFYYLFSFNIFNVFIGFVFAGSIFALLDGILPNPNDVTPPPSSPPPPPPPSMPNGTFANITNTSSTSAPAPPPPPSVNVFEEPLKIVDLLGAALPGQVNFYIAFIATKSLGAFMIKLMSIGPALVGLIMGKFLAKTTRSLAEIRTPRHYLAPKEAADAMLTFVIASTFATLAPLIIPFALVYALLNLVVTKFIITYDVAQRWDAGGYLFKPFFNCAMLGLIVYQLTLAGVFGLRLFPAGSTICLIMGIISIALLIALPSRLDALVAYGPLEELAEADSTPLADAELMADIYRAPAFRALDGGGGPFAANLQDDQSHVQEIKANWAKPPTAIPSTDPLLAAILRNDHGRDADAVGDIEEVAAAAAAAAEADGRDKGAKKLGKGVLKASKSAGKVAGKGAKAVADKGKGLAKADDDDDDSSAAGSGSGSGSGSDSDSDSKSKSKSKSGDDSSSSSSSDDEKKSKSGDDSDSSSSSDDSKTSSTLSSSSSASD